MMEILVFVERGSCRFCVVLLMMIFIVAFVKFLRLVWFMMLF